MRFALPNGDSGGVLAECSTAACDRPVAAPNTAALVAGWLGRIDICDPNRTHPLGLRYSQKAIFLEFYLT